MNYCIRTYAWICIFVIVAVLANSACGLHKQESIFGHQHTDGKVYNISAIIDNMKKQGLTEMEAKESIQSQFPTIPEDKLKTAIKDKYHDGSGNGDPNGSFYIPVNIELTDDEAIKWMRGNGYTINYSGRSGFIYRKAYSKDSGNNITTSVSFGDGATIIGRTIYDKFVVDVGSLNIANGRISITIKRKRTRKQVSK